MGRDIEIEKASLLRDGLGNHMKLKQDPILHSWKELTSLFLIELRHLLAKHLTQRDSRTRRQVWPCFSGYFVCARSKTTCMHRMAGPQSNWVGLFVNRRELSSITTFLWCPNRHVSQLKLLIQSNLQWEKKIVSQTRRTNWSRTNRRADLWSVGWFLFSHA